MSDLSCVREELLDVSTKWFDIGLKLKLSVGTLECVRDQYRDPFTSLREMLLHWLKTVDPPPTWEGLACVLESRTVGEPRLAEQLRTKYCKTEGAAGQSLYITETIGHFWLPKPPVLLRVAISVHTVCSQFRSAFAFISQAMLPHT